MTKKDPHSCWAPDAGQIQHINFDLDVDFDERVLRGHADYRFISPLGNNLELPLQ